MCPSEHLLRLRQAGKIKTIGGYSQPKHESKYLLEKAEDILLESWFKQSKKWSQITLKVFFIICFFPSLIFLDSLNWETSSLQLQVLFSVFLNCSVLVSLLLPSPWIEEDWYSLPHLSQLSDNENWYGADIQAAMYWIVCQLIRNWKLRLSLSQKRYMLEFGWFCLYLPWLRSAMYPEVTIVSTKNLL